jgi:predicted CopG family antitoxin
MARLTISLPEKMYNRISSLSIQENDSMSGMINRLIEIGLYQLSEEPQKKNPKINKNYSDQHCQQLIIQMNALIKNISSEVLKYDQEDFEKLRQISLQKYNDLIGYNHEEIM